MAKKQKDLSQVTFAEQEAKESKLTENEQTKEAMRLIRCEITSNNPNKVNYQGEIFSVKNAALPEVKKYIQYGVPTHVPQILLNTLKERELQVSYEERLPDGARVRRTRLTKEFNINILPPITAEELEAIKKKQLAEGFNGK